MNKEIPPSPVFHVYNCRARRRFYPQEQLRRGLRPLRNPGKHAGSWVGAISLFRLIAQDSGVLQQGQCDSRAPDHRAESLIHQSGRPEDCLLGGICCIPLMDPSHPWIGGISMDGRPFHGNLPYVSWMVFLPPTGLLSIDSDPICR